jgi:hypothetical protein
MGLVHLRDPELFSILEQRGIEEGSLIKMNLQERMFLCHSQTKEVTLELMQQYISPPENYPSRMTGKSKVVLKKHIFVKKV